MGKKKEQAFKSMLGKSGYSEKASDEIWKWYTAPTQETKIAIISFEDQS